MTVRIGVIGCGYWGPNLIRNFVQLSDVEISGICDLRQERSAYVKSQYPNLKATKDYTELLNDPHINGMVIATPVESHYRLARESLLAGKDVLVEKPLALKTDQCQELIKIAQKNDRILMVGHTFLYNVAIRKLKEFIAQGELGDIFYIYSSRLNLGMVRHDINALWNFAPHDISIILYLLEKEPTRVAAKGLSYIQKGIEDVIFLDLDFKEGIMAHIHVSWVDPNKVRRMTIVGSKKMVVYDDVNPDEKIKVYDKGIDRIFSTDVGTFEEFTLKLRAGDIYIPQINFVEPLRLECVHFIECLQKREKPMTDGQDGFRVVKVLEAAQKSLENNGAPVELEAKRDG